MLIKLPDDIVHRWSKRLHGDQDYPNFETFVNFISREADILCNPITNLNDDQNDQNTRTHVALANGSAEIEIYACTVRRSIILCMTAGILCKRLRSKELNSYKKIISASAF